jgi:lyso-ornithine lipid O-acyltransferase
VDSSNKPATITKSLRIGARGIKAVCCVLGCLVEYGVHAATGKLRERARARILRKWSKRLLSSMKVSVLVEGPLPEQGLIVSNHLSYLDIVVFSSVCECIFISKHEVKSWPGIGWIASLAGTIYIDRTRRSDTHAIQPDMQSALSDRLRLVLFPEGTSSDGSAVLHFHSSLFQAALDLDAPITAASLDYFIADGEASREACYWGDMVLLPHLLNLFTKRSVQATVKFSPEQHRFRDRKEAARTMRTQVERLRGLAVEMPR